MPKIDPVINAKIDEYHEDGYLTNREVDVLKAYFSHKTRKGAAHAVRILVGSLSSMLSVLKRDGVLIQVKRGSYELNEDVESIKRGLTPPPPLPAQIVDTVAMSEKEREWMNANYKNYKNNRSGAARILNRSKYDVCRMAIELRLDQKSRN